MTRLAVIRHGPTAWNAAKLNQGRSDVPLSASGRQEVMTWVVREPWRGWPVFTSPLRRARETADLLFGRATIEPRLIEMAWGAWEGRGLAELRDEFGVQMQANEDRGLDFRPPEGESPREVLNRLSPWLREVAARGENCVAVSHRGVLRVLLALAFDWNMLGKPPTPLARAALHEFDLDRRGHPTPRQLNVPLSGP